VTFAIAAAGTGGHVFPGLAVGEALVAGGVSRSDVMYLGGDRLEATVYPEAGFGLHQVELRGLQRSLSPKNLTLPGVVWRAVSSMSAEMRARGVGAVLGLGGYVTIPAALAARRLGVPFAVSEQNAEAGLANAVAGRFADRCFGAFPETRRLPRAEWVGNPIRASLAGFDRRSLEATARGRYGLDPDVPVLGVFGGSLGAGVLNRAVAGMVTAWDGRDVQILHLAGTEHAPDLERVAAGASIRWVVVAFETRMELFYAACDLVLARAGGAVAELAATATPSILVPGAFGSGRHQQANAAAFARRGAAHVITEDRLADLGDSVRRLLGDAGGRAEMGKAAGAMARPHAAEVIAAALEEMHG
jgi:UDP-N-acetylglucosamine--N-acetylmuramyl-(pentapeptide) pyrophosphoryl-undecaprenol N-acetylglucosamine transferase